MRRAIGCLCRAGAERSREGRSPGLSPSLMLVPSFRHDPSGSCGWWLSVPTQRMVDGSWGTGRRRPWCGCPGSGETKHWGMGCARPACGSNATRPWGRRRVEPYGGDPAGRQWGKVVQRGGRGSGTHRAGHATTALAPCPNAAVNGAPDRPREVQGSRHAVQSSTSPPATARDAEEP